MSNGFLTNAATSPMRDFYQDKIVFLTGSTGVLGELFVEKLLRCNVNRLYILLRAKKEKTPHDRIADVCSTALYKRLRHQDPNFMARISVIIGDMALPNLGISGADIALLNGCVQIVIHAAANVRFDCPLHTIVLTNVRGTRDLLRLAMGFQRLMAFAYISTAYCHSHKLNNSTAERFYRAPIHPETIIRLAEWFEANPAQAAGMLQVLTDKLIDPWPNTYSYSKAITEDLVRRSLPALPIVVVRPSIVIATFEDPIPGYCTNYFGLNGVLSACGAGLSRIIFGETRNVANVVCADFVTNGTLAIVWDKIVNHKVKDPPIYAMNSGHQDLTWGQISESCFKRYQKFPWIKAVWLTRTNYTMCPFMGLYYTIVYQVLPGIIFDIFLRITGSKDRLLPMYRRIIMFMFLIKFFMSTQWHFAVDNMKDVYSRMEVSDRQYFPVGGEKLDFPKFSFDYALGLRQYISCETLDTLPAAKKKFIKLRMLHYASLVLYYLTIAAVYYWMLKRVALIAV